MNHSNDQCRVVSQNGRVMSVHGDVADIQIVQTSACASCRIRGICAAGDAKARTIPVQNNGSLTPGTEVRLDMKERYGWIGVLFAFVLPLVIVVGALFGFRAPFRSEELAALAGIGLLIPYYGALYLTRDLFIRTIRFDAYPLAAHVTASPITTEPYYKEGAQ